MKQISALSIALLASCLFTQYANAECISGDCMNGQGTYHSEDGVKYIGHWKNGTQDGQGTYIYADGGKYIGLWVNGQMHGQGTFTSTSGKNYVGQWKNGLAHGQGTYSWESGDEYTGQLKEGKMHGLGTFTFASGSKYVGLWKDDVQDGQSTYYTSKGLIKNVTYENGKQIDSRLTLPSKAWFPKNTGKSEFLGMYKTSDRETLSELFVLEDNTFCFTFMGGSVDLIIAGTWEQSTSQTNTILLKETKNEKYIHLVRGQNFNRLDNKISVTINGYSLRDINTPVFAFSQDDTLPTTFRPLLPKNNNTGRAIYAFPLLRPTDAKYIYLGSIETSDTDNVSQLQVTQYEMGINDTFQLAYDTQKSQLPKVLEAQLIEGKLLINGEPTDSKTDLFPEMVKAVKNQCIDPIRQQENSDEAIGWVKLKPSNIFYLDESIITNDPYFSKDDGDEARHSNSINQLIKDEKKLLALHYEKANKDVTTFNELLLVSKGLLQREGRKNIYIEDINMKLSQLLINTIRGGDVASAQEQFNAYATQIHPLIKDSTNKQVQYSILVVASQGAIIYGATRDETVLATILDTLLGKNFDIETTTNPTLVYNLACIYSLNKNKPEMLKAIAVARKMNKKSEQFLKDGDFAFYLNDRDFLNAIQ